MGNPDRKSRGPYANLRSLFCRFARSSPVVCEPWIHDWAYRIRGQARSWRASPERFVGWRTPTAATRFGNGLPLHEARSTVSPQRSNSAEGWGYGSRDHASSLSGCSGVLATASRDSCQRNDSECPTLLPIARGANGVSGSVTAASSPSAFSSFAEREGNQKVEENVAGDG